MHWHLSQIIFNYLNNKITFIFVSFTDTFRPDYSTFKSACVVLKWPFNSYVNVEIQVFTVVPLGCRPPCASGAGTMLPSIWQLVRFVQKRSQKPAEKPKLTKLMNTFVMLRVWNSSSCDGSPSQPKLVPQESGVWLSCLLLPKVPSSPWSWTVTESWRPAGTSLAKCSVGRR